jgi:hypothetical protein
LKTIRFLDKEAFTDWPEGERREMDLLAEVPVLDDEQSCVLIHVEIEAASRPGMDRRIWRYFHLLQARDERPVLSIVAFLKGGEPGIRLQTLEYTVLGAVRGHLAYTAFGIAGSLAEDFLPRSEPLAWALAALMRPGLLTRAELKLACLRRIAGSGLNEIEIFLLVNCVETYLQLSGQDAVDYAAMQARQENQEIQTMEMTWAEMLEAKGEKKGLRKGRQEGREEVRQLLLEQLGQRFGPLPKSVQQRVEAISSMERLKQIARQILVAQTLDEMDLA